MAEINAAYEQLRGGARSPGPASPRFDRDATPTDRAGRPGGATGKRSGGPPPPPKSRPVTRRVDTSTTFRPRNSTITSGPAILRGVRVPFPGRTHRATDPLRASSPTGPVERGRVRNFRRPARPTLEHARERVLEFGKFRGHTLVEVAAFEPSYIDWLARTISRDPELVAAARVVRDELDRLGVRRRDRQGSPGQDQRRSAV